MQWWSISCTQRQQVLQWCALGGLTLRQMSHQGEHGLSTFGTVPGSLYDATAKLKIAKVANATLDTQMKIFANKE